MFSLPFHLLAPYPTYLHSTSSQFSCHTSTSGLLPASCHHSSPKVCDSCLWSLGFLGPWCKPPVYPYFVYVQVGHQLGGTSPHLFRGRNGLELSHPPALSTPAQSHLPPPTYPKTSFQVPADSPDRLWHLWTLPLHLPLPSFALPFHLGASSVPIPELALALPHFRNSVVSAATCDAVRP